MVFDQNNITAELYTNISIDSCINLGMVVDGGAIKFWLMTASDGNRHDLFEPQPRGIRESLTAFTTFFHQNNGAWLWSHGSNFDIPMLAAAYKATGHGSFVPWTYRLTRDTRTLFSLAKDAEAIPRAAGNKHNALADAIYQAKQVQAAYQALGQPLEIN